MKTDNLGTGNLMSTTYKGIIREGRVEFETPVTLPEGSRVIVLAATLDEPTARRRANRWLADNVGNVVGTGKPGVLLQTGNHTVWRFEAFIIGLTYATPLGPLGQVEVEANTGQVLNNQQAAQEMSERG